MDMEFLLKGIPEAAQKLAHETLAEWTEEDCNACDELAERVHAILLCYTFYRQSTFKSDPVVGVLEEYLRKTLVTIHDERKPIDFELCSLEEVLKEGWNQYALLRKGALHWGPPDGSCLRAQITGIALGVTHKECSEHWKEVARSRRTQTRSVVKIAGVDFVPADKTDAETKSRRRPRPYLEVIEGDKK